MPTTTDELAIRITAAASVPREQVWHVLVERTDEWWGAPYLGPDADPMTLDARLGGQLRSGEVVHGTIRAFDPPERLEIGGVLVPGAYAGSVTITVERTSMGSEIRVEQLARGRVDALVEDRMTTGWAHLLATLTALADA